MKWFGAYTLYKTTLASEPTGPILVEQRVVLVQAINFDEAIAKATQEANAYVEDGRWVNSEGERVVQSYLGVCEAFEIGAEIQSGSEVYSSMYTDETDRSADEIVARHMGPDRDDRTTDVMGRFEPDFEQTAASDEEGKSSPAEDDDLK